MSEKDSNSLIENKNNSEYKWKELLYNLFYEIKSEILGTKIEIEEEEYQENIRTITIPKLVSYIHDSIQILISNKIEMSKNSQKLEDEKIYKMQLNPSQKNLTLDTNERLKYENIIKKLEEKERILYRINFHDKLQKEAMENKIEEYIEMEEEFEEMKAKFKYENGRFLNNDRKDNEILILRSENSKLKNSITEMEKNIMKLEKLNEEKKNKINILNEEINELKLRIETKQTELNLSQNYFYNKTHNLTKNNTNTNTIKYKGLINNEENSNEQLNQKIKSFYKISNEKNKDKDKKEYNNTVKYYRNQNITVNQTQFNKIKNKILSYKRKNIEGNNKKHNKGNTNTNKDFINSTRNEYTERLCYKHFSGSNIEKFKNNNNNIGNKNILNKKKNEMKKDSNQISYGKFSYLFNKKNNNINNIYSIKKIVSSGSVKSSRPHSTKKNTKKQTGSTYRSSSGD